jgi:Dimerisation domain of Zinc Transporter
VHEELQTEVKDILHSLQDDDVSSITSIRARQVGSASVAEVTVEIQPDLSTTATRALEERIQHHLQKELSKENVGRSIIATVHAKPHLVICPLLQSDEAKANNKINNSNNNMNFDSLSSSNGVSDGVVEDPVNAVITTRSSNDNMVSASQIEHDVRQQALLLYPKIRCQVTGVTVHFSSPNAASVECDIQVDQQQPKSSSNLDDDNNTKNGDSEGSTLPMIQGYAKELQSALETNLPMIESARIYLDLNQPVVVSTTR